MKIGLNTYEVTGNKNATKIQVSKKLELELSYDPVPEHKCKAFTIGILGNSAIASIFTRAKKWNQPRYASADEWVMKMCYKYKMKYYSVIEKSEI